MYGVRRFVHMRSQVQRVLIILNPYVAVLRKKETEDRIVALLDSVKLHREYEAVL